MSPHTRCCVHLCTNTFATAPQGTTWHAIPKDAKMRKVWMAKIWPTAQLRQVARAEGGGESDDGFKVTKNTVVCSIHFNKWDFRPLLNQKRRYLKKNAFPSRFEWTLHDETESTRTYGGRKSLKCNVAKKQNTKEKLETDEVEESSHDSTDDPDFNIVQACYGTENYDQNASSNGNNLLSYTLTETVVMLQAEKDRLEQENANLRSELDSQKKQNELLRRDHETLKETRSSESAKFERITTKLDLRLLTYDNIKHDKNLVSFYTGFDNDLSFSAFYAYLEEKADKLTYLHGSGTTKNAQHRSTPVRLKLGVYAKLSNKDMLFLVLLRLKVGFPTSEVARMFGIGVTIVKRIFTTWIAFLYAELKALFPFPSISVLDGTMVPRFDRDTTLTIDCSDVRVQKASMLKTQKNLFTYKHVKKMKFLLATLSNGSVSFVSPLFDGGSPDKKVVQDSGLLKLLMTGHNIVADERFEIGDILPEGVCSNLPSDVTNKTDATVVTEKVASDKAHIERAIRRLKTYHIFDSAIPLRLGDFAAQIVAVCAYLTNLKPAFMKRITPL